MKSLNNEDVIELLL